MKTSLQWKRILYVTGVVLLIAGALDPMEGSVLIAAGSIILSVASWLIHDRHRMLFLVFGILIAFGVIALFYLSSLGGFGGNSKLSYAWGLFILPYPIGWLASIILLIVRGIQNRKRKPVAS